MSLRREKIKRYINRVRLWKTISWRIISGASTFAIAFILTGNVAVSLSFSFADTIIKLILYWAHEYKWDKITNEKIQSIKDRYNKNMEKL